MNKKFVFTIQEDICLKNDKPVDAVELLKVMSSYGTVVSYDEAISVVKAEDQKIIDGLTAQVTAIKDLNLTEDEVFLVNAYRSLKAEKERKLIAENEMLSNKLLETQEIFNTTMGKIQAIVNKPN